MDSNESAQKYDLIIGIDRSDKEIEVVTVDAHGHRSGHSVATEPVQLHDWWKRLCAQYPGAHKAVAFEQPARNLIAFFEYEPDVTIYALNPSSIWAYRQSLTPSRAHTDKTDADCIARFIEHHHGDLKAYVSPDPKARQIQSYCTSRRKLVDQRTGLTNRLQSVLKHYFPEAILLMHENIHRGMNLELLRKWPTAQSIKRARIATVEKFFHAHGSRSAARLEARLAIIGRMQPLTENPAIIEPCVMEMLCVVDQVDMLNGCILRYTQKIRKLMQSDPRAALFEQLPGAGPALAPRLFAAFSIYADNCKDAAAMASLVGMAPVTEQSGKVRRVYRRLRCDRFLAQSFHEWAAESWKHSKWAKAYVRHHQEAGMHFHTIVRKLATRWIRILFRLWKTGGMYDEQRYIQTLLSKGHYLKNALLQP